MEFSFDMFEIYRHFCDITSKAVANKEEGCGTNDESQKARITREALSQLLTMVESKASGRVSILEEVYKLMPRLGLMSDYLEFSRFYDFVFFICRENGQKNITVSRAVMAWKLVLAGRFRLLNQWCNFVEKNQRHNISEDTWRQVLAFSRCVHENLEGYDPEGAWPILIDDFVEYMYRSRGSDRTHNVCNCCDSEQCDDTHSGLKNFPGSKRKLVIDSADGHVRSINVLNSKRRHLYLDEKAANWGENEGDSAEDDYSEIVKHTTSPLGCSKTSPCAIEGCLSKGFEGLLSSHSYLQLDRDRRVSYT